MDTLSISWTMVNMWLHNKREELLAYYDRISIPISTEMEYGKYVHSRIATEQMKLLPIMTNGVYEDREKKINVFEYYIDPWLKLKGIIDYIQVEGDSFLIDWKTGNTSISQINQAQLYTYDLLLHEYNISMKYGIFCKVYEDQEDNIQVGDYVISIFSDDKRNYIRNFYLTYGSEIYLFLEELGRLNKRK